MKRYLLFPENDHRRESSETGEEKDIKHLDFVNEADGVKAKFSFSRPVIIWFYPIMTVSQSEEGFEKSYQGTSLLFIHQFSLAATHKTISKVTIQFINLNY